MIREIISKNQLETSGDFRFRGKEPGRLENFSDAVFALAITLLLISTSPPVNFDQIKRFTYELLPFLLCISLIILIWREHYVFFVRYGLRDGKMIALNTLFLVIVLFYVYPLKFLTRLILRPLAYVINNQSLQEEIQEMIKGEDMGQLMVIYGVGAAAVFLVLMQMYRYAYKRADELELNEIERFDTRSSIRANLLMALVPILSVILAAIFQNSWMAGPLSGFTYILYTPIMIAHSRHVDRTRKKLLSASESIAFE